MQLSFVHMAVIMKGCLAYASFMAIVFGEPSLAGSSLLPVFIHYL